MESTNANTLNFPAASSFKASCPQGLLKDSLTGKTILTSSFFDPSDTQTLKILFAKVAQPFNRSNKVFEERNPDAFKASK